MEGLWEYAWNRNMRDNRFMKPDLTLADTQPTRRRTGDPTDSVNRAQLEALLHKARTAGDRDTALEYVQRAVDLRPDDPRVLSSVQLSMFDKLSSDAFLAFLAETDGRYVITFRNSRPFSVPKARNEPEQYPPQHRTEAERAMRMMWWMILGLVPAGVGAVILSPLALRHGIRALQRDYKDPQQHRMAWAAIFVALSLGLLGAFFSALLVLHLLLG
jgi:hypothetical protein